MTIFNKNKITDTIAAIATPNAAGGIGVVRISGSYALQAAARSFKPKSRVDITKSKGYRVYYGHILACAGDALDEVLCTVFRAPKSYTGEDCVEISCHGGMYVTRRILREMISQNDAVRMARPGEFTERAYLNGRIALEQAEAVAALISAQGESSLKAAQAVLDGTLGAKITALTEVVAAQSAELAAWVDYPDDDIDEPSGAAMLAKLEPVSAELEKLLKNYENGRVLVEGADTVICGKPNTGKSTLMNLLCGAERAIVTDIPGTTRDIIEETVRLGELPLRLADTAGLRESDSVVERIGIERARERAKSADLILAVIDGSKPLSHEDKSLLESIKQSSALIIINKSDLFQKVEPEELSGYGKTVVSLCAKTGEGLEKIRAAIERQLGTADFDPSAAMLINERQRVCCEMARGFLLEALDALKSGVTLDAVQILLDDALNSLLELRGQNASDAVSSAVFERFCVGK